MQVNVCALAKWFTCHNNNYTKLITAVLDESGIQIPEYSNTCTRVSRYLQQYGAEPPHKFDWSLHESKTLK